LFFSLRNSDVFERINEKKRDRRRHLEQENLKTVSFFFLFSIDSIYFFSFWNKQSNTS
jgi:hypothetical protein